MTLRIDPLLPADWPAVREIYLAGKVGRRSRIGSLDGVWRDTILLERRSQRIGID